MHRAKHPILITQYISRQTQLQPELIKTRLSRSSVAAGSKAFPGHLRKVSDDGELRVVSQRNDELMDHQSEDPELGGTAVVELDGALLELGLFVEGVPAEVDPAVAEVANELVASPRDVTHEGALKDADEGDDLHDPGGGDVVRADEGGNAVGVAREGVSRVVDVSWEVDASAGGDLAQEGQHRNAAVLDLDVPEAVEALLIRVAELPERVEEPERRLDTELGLEAHAQGRGDLGGLLGRSEGGGGGQDGGGDNGLHGIDNNGTEL
jgi:hypothetical protein